MNRRIGPDPKWRMDVLEWLKGGVVAKPEIAIRLGELFLEVTQSLEELALQRPLTVEDQGDTFLVRGSPTGIFRKKEPVHST